MPAIVTDQLRIINCNNFLNDVASGRYYIFLGLPNATVFDTGWDSSPPDPIDATLYTNSYRDTILGVKKVNSSDAVRVIRKIQWQSGKKYDMYRHDYSIYNTAPVTSATRLYDANYYVINKDYRVYICINNGSAPSNSNLGVASTQEPLHTDLSPRKESDGYSWKYLYTLSPADVLKFDSTDYVSVPNNWTTSTDDEITRVRDNAVDGKIETILIEEQQIYNYFGTLTGVPIRGDGSGGLATVTFDEESKPISVEVTNGGSGYTYATLDLDSILPSLTGNKAIFNVIIPPAGGHGDDVYRELGANKVLIYGRIENDPTNPDFVVGNQFSRIGIIKNIKNFGSESLFTKATGSGVFGAKVTTSITEPLDSKMTQPGSNAVGNLVSFDSTTNVAKYIQPRTNLIDTYQVGTKRVIDYHYADSSTGIQTATNYIFTEFSPTTIDIGSSSYSVDTGFNDDSVTVGSVTYYLGQGFNNGLSSPDINIKSGEIVYVDNRSSVTRASQQREDIKIILEF